MRTYEKIDTVFNRDTTGTKQLMWNNWRDPVVEYLRNNIWLFTEKVDGTNIRIHWDGHQVEFGGRTDKAQIPDFLLDKLRSMFGTAEAEELFEQTWGEKEVFLFGEGYGPKIQSGGDYRADVSFILFDVLVGDNYQERKWVEKTAEMFGIDVVPIVLMGTIQDGIDFVMRHPESTMGTAMMEGVVGRPAVEMRDRRGNRVIVKIKWDDFKVFAHEI